MSNETEPKAEPAALTDAEKYALIEKYLGLVPRRDDTVVDPRTGRFTPAGRYFALIDAAMAAAPRAPKGYALVPVEATPEMVAAGLESIQTVQIKPQGERRWVGHPSFAWTAMLGAAQSPKQSA